MAGAYGRTHKREDTGSVRVRHVMKRENPDQVLYTLTQFYCAIALDSSGGR